MFVLFTVLGAVIGGRLGQVEPQPRSVKARIVLLWWALAAFGSYAVLEIGLPYLGRWLPIVYEADTVFWSLLFVRSAVWGFGVGVVVRLLARLERLVASRPSIG